MKKSQAAPKKSPRDLLIDDLQRLREEAKPHVIRAGIQETEFDVPVRDLDKLSDEALNELIQWHKEFRATAIQGVLEIWLLKPEEWWGNLVTLFSLHKTREQKLLRAAQKKLRISWRKRHGKLVKEETCHDT